MNSGTWFRSLRLPLILPILLILIVPLFGQITIGYWIAALEHGMKKNMLASARALVDRFGSNAELVRRARFIPELVPGRDLYASKLVREVVLDGRDDEWDSNEFVEFNVENMQVINAAYETESLSFRLRIGVFDDVLSLHLSVLDDVVVYRAINSLSVHQNDHVQLGLIDNAGNYQRYTIAVRQPGAAYANVVTSGGRSLRQESAIQGTWLATEHGYNLELSLPVSMLGRGFAVAVADVDDAAERSIKFIMGSADPSQLEMLGTLLVRDKVLDGFLESAAVGQAWLLDAHQRVIAESVDDSQSEALWDDFGPGARERTAPDPSVPTGPHISSALTGVPRAAVFPVDGALGRFSVAYPVRIDGEIAGALLIAQMNDDIVKLREYWQLILFVSTGVSLLAGLMVWLVLSGWIIRRIDKIRQSLVASVDAQGRLRVPIEDGRSADELGTLQSELAGTTRRLQQYNQYLEDMASRLSHELRTPISVIRSSLENISVEKLQGDEAVYVERAHTGVRRLTMILNKMSEARRLEQSLNDDELRSFDLAQLVSGCVSGYEAAYPNSRFERSIEVTTLWLSGAPDLIAQLMDKLIDNAVEFAVTGSAVKVRLTLEQGQAVLRVINDGPGLPQSEDKLFDSMVSKRPGLDSSSSHLGMGLYIASVITDFHGGSIEAQNREDTQGVIVTVRLPLMRAVPTASV